jgi:hypothetical protein
MRNRLGIPAMERQTLRTVLACAIFVIALQADIAVAATYESFKTGKLEGKLIVQWIEPDKFIFLPDRDSPLTFTRSNGEKITPSKMLTDGGSIPRPLWILRNYSPWGYAPAFIVHDWLFTMKYCHVTGYDKFTYLDAADIMAEIMKTMMETKKVEVDKLTLISMHAAVSSFLAEDEWNNGKCIPPPASLGGKKPLLEYELVFP